MSIPKHRDPLMVSIWCELGRGRIVEEFITDAKAFVDGEVSSKGRIVINPVHQTCDTIIHELLHRLHPAWSEQYVRNRTTFLRRRMTDAEIQAFYDEYQKVVKKSKRHEKHTGRDSVPEVRSIQRAAKEDPHSDRE